MPIDAVVAIVDLRTDEPPGIRNVPFEDCAPGLEPVDGLSLLGPETVGIGFGAFVDPGIIPVRLGLELVRWRVAAILLQECVERAIGAGSTARGLCRCHGFALSHLRWRDGITGACRFSPIW